MSEKAKTSGKPYQPDLQLLLFDHQTLLLMSLQKLRDPKDPSKPLLNRTDIVQNLGNSKEEAHSKLTNISAQFRDLPSLGIPKLTQVIQDGNLDFKTWYQAKADTFKEAQIAQRIDAYATKNRTVKDAPIGAINFTDPEYPDNLWTEKNKDFPPVLTYQGNKDALNQGLSTTLVGSRNLEPAVAKATAHYGVQFAKDGINTVSGLATGADAAGARGNVEYLKLIQNKPEALAKAGKPIHILSKGLNTSIYPKDNHALAKDIVYNGGVLVSEYAPNSAAPGNDFKKQLVERDKWQTVMADGFVATKAGLNKQPNGYYRPSGTRHALLEAIDQNRPMAMLDPSQVPELKNQSLDRTYEYNQMNITQGKAMGLGVNVQDSNVVNQFHKFEAKLNANHQNRMAKLQQDPSYDSKGPNNSGIDR